MIQMLLVGCSLSGPAPKPAPVPAADPAPAASPPAVVIANSREQWPRAEKDKPSGPMIEVSLPVVKVSDPAVQAKLNALLVPETLLGDSKASIMDASWADTVTWKTGFNKADLLDLNVTVEGCAAYCDSYMRAVVVDLKTGDAVGMESLEPAQVEALVARLDKTLQARIAEKVKEDPEVAEILQDRHVKADDLPGYGLSPAGIVFHLHFGLPHAMAAAEPDTDFVLPWAEAGTFLTANSPLRRAI